MADGTTILLTTQDRGEADRLAYWIVVIDTGRVVEQGTAGQPQGSGRRVPTTSGWLKGSAARGVRESPGSGDGRLPVWR